jgi:leucyl-tRNA synthetase
VWRLVTDNLEGLSSVSPYDGRADIGEALAELHRRSNVTIKRVTSDIETRFHFNTAIAAVMELVNEANQYITGHPERMDKTAWAVVREAVETTVVMLSPVVPHITAELWEMLGGRGDLVFRRWPGYSEKALETEKRLVVLQVNGKVRNRIEVPSSLGDKELEEAALADPRVKQFIDGKKVRKVIVVQGKLVNVVV